MFFSINAKNEYFDRLFMEGMNAMGRTILFSPVGGTDPISATNVFDGSLLHICRFYKPDKVVLYMSAEVLKLQEEDDRYRYCLKRLLDLQNREMEIESIERPELTEVQDFDFFYDDFRDVLKKVYANLKEDDELLLNVSSGTPAMKSTLMVLGTFGEIPCRLIQVATPVRKMNEHQHKNYDVATLWELDEDNNDNAENRCSEIQCPSLLMLKQEEMIKQHLIVYDYRAALTITESMPSAYTKSYLKLLKIADFRQQLLPSEVDKICNPLGINVFPVRDGNKRKCFEYALMLQNKLARKEYADFIRGISPLLKDLFELILMNQCGTDINRFTSDRNGMKQWDKNKLTVNDPKVTTIFNCLSQSFRNSNYTPVYSSALRDIIDKMSSDSSLKQVVGDLRDVESKVRNLAAHEIVSITADTIRSLTGLTPEQIMKKIKTAFTYAGMNIRSEQWKSYDDMNQQIINAMTH